MQMGKRPSENDKEETAGVTFICLCSEGVGSVQYANREKC